MPNDLEQIMKDRPTVRRLGWIRIDVESSEEGVVRMLPEDDRSTLPGRWVRAPWLDQPEAQ
jgi:hypothetical protein